MSIETAIEKLAAAIEKLAMAQLESNVISSKLIPINTEFISKLDKAVENLPEKIKAAPPVETGPKPGPTETVVKDPEPEPTPENTAGPDEFDDFEPGPDAGPTDTVEPEKVDPPEPKVVMALLRRIASEIGNTDAVNLLAEFGAKKFSEVPVDQYPDFKTLAEKVLGVKQ